MPSTTDRRKRIVVLISGGGSNLQALIDAGDDLGGEIVGVFSNREDAVGLQRARTAGVPAIAVVPTEGEPRPVYDSRLADAVARFEPDLVVLAGWMRLLSSTFLDRFDVINLHPALPGEYPGVRAIERAFDDAHNGGRDHTGVMVHRVPDEGVDDGPVLATMVVPIRPDDSLDSLSERIHQAEHRLLTETVRQLCLGATTDHRAIASTTT